MASLGRTWLLFKESFALLAGDTEILVFAIGGRAILPAILPAPHFQPALAA